jgi:hypothetical protein
MSGCTFAHPDPLARSAEGNIACARKNGCTSRQKLSSAVFSLRSQGFHSTLEGLLADALAAGGARRICTCCSRRILQKVFRTSVSKLGLHLNGHGPSTPVAARLQVCWTASGRTKEYRRQLISTSTKVFSTFTATLR